MARRDNDPRELARSASITEARSSHAHPWNPRSELHGTRLSDLVGLQRTGVSLVRLPPGRESFAYHLHHYEEEWLYILSGTGTAEIDGGEYPVEAGDFMGFPTPSVPHHLKNTGDTDLVYLMGGENREYEVADFPELNKRMVRRGSDVDIYDLDAGRPMEPLADEGQS